MASELSTTTPSSDHSLCAPLETSSRLGSVLSELDLQNESAARQKLLDSVQRAIVAGDEELAGDLAHQAYCLSRAARESAHTVAETASVAIEAALDSGHQDVAVEIFENASSSGLGSLSSDDSGRLRFAMAEARIMSFRDQTETSLALRTDLQSRLIRTFGTLSTESIVNRIRIANARMELGHASAALSDLISLRDQIKDLPDIDTRTKILETRAIAVALSLLGRENEALETLRSTRRELALQLGDNHSSVLNIDQSISETLTRVHRTEEALEISARVFVSRYANVDIGDPKALRALWDIAYLYTDNERFDTARLILNFLYKQWRSHPSRYTRQFYFQTLSLLAYLDLSEGYLLSAREKYETVYLGLLDIYGPDSEDTQIEAMNLASVYRRTGLIAEGCKLLADVEKSVTETRPSDIWALGYARIEHGRCLLTSAVSNDADQTLASMRVSWNAISAHEELTSRDAMMALGSYANATLQAGYRAEAKRLLIQFAELAEESRASGPEGSLTRTSAFSSWVSSGDDADNNIAGYRQLALLYAQDAELERALRISELARDRILRDRFAEQEWQRTKLPNDARSQLGELVERIQGFDERIAVEANIIERIRLESERTLLVAERNRLERELRDRLHLSQPAVRLPTLDALRAVLRPDTALISVLHSGDSWWALVILRDQPARFVEFGDPDLGRNASAWLRRFRGEPVRAWPLKGDRLAIDAIRPGDATGPYLTVDQLAQRLSNRLLVPLEKAVGKARRLVFVGDDELVGVPLQALPLRSGFGLDRFEISYAPSLTTYSQWQGRARTAAHNLDLLAIGGIDYKPIAPPATDDPIAIGVQVAQDHPLPFARTEIDAIAAQFPKERATEWTGTQANKAAVLRASRSGELRQYRYVHFAAHAWAQPNRPEASAIVLAARSPDDRPTQRALTATELAGLQMSSELLVLSACETGVGHFEHGQGLLGLAFAGLAAGNRAALLSLFPIADETTAIFMQHLYAKLRRGWNPVSALAATQREFRHSEDPKLATPAAWAPFILYGGY